MIVSLFQGDYTSAYMHCLQQQFAKKLQNTGVQVAALVAPLVFQLRSENQYGGWNER